MFFVVAAVGTFLSGFLTACGKKGDDGAAINYGSLSSDGNSVSTKSAMSVQGVPLSLTIRNIQAYATGMQQQQIYCFTYPCNTGSSQVNFELVIGGTGQYQQVNATTFDYAQWTSVANWYVKSAAMCTDASCGVVVVSVIVCPYLYGGQYNTEFRQVAVKRDMRAGKVIAIREFTLQNPSQAHQPQQLIYEF
jgi:hypothetical protein